MGTHARAFWPKRGPHRPVQALIRQFWACADLAQACKACAWVAMGTRPNPRVPTGWVRHLKTRPMGTHCAAYLQIICTIYSLIIFLVQCSLLLGQAARLQWLLLIRKPRVGTLIMLSVTKPIQAKGRRSCMVLFDDSKLRRKEEIYSTRQEALI